MLAESVKALSITLALIAIGCATGAASDPPPCAVTLAQELKAPETCSEESAEAAPPKPPVPEKAVRPPQPKDEELDTILKKMKAARKKLRAVKTDVVFEQTIVALDFKETWKGELLFQMPRLMKMSLRLKDKDGERYKLYVVGEKYAWIYTKALPDIHQAEKFPLASLKEKDKSAANPLEYGLAADIDEVRKVYNLTYKGIEPVGKRPAHKLEFVPKNKKADVVYAKMILWIGKDLWLPIKIEQHKSDGEQVEVYILSNIKPRKSFPKRTWRFKPPKDAAVMEWSRNR